MSFLNTNNKKILNNVQFLRGISVLLVFFYHLELKYFEYGYLGVDIFFVISGFVITSIIYRELFVTGKFNLFNFYINRIKRLYPILLFILSISFTLVIFFQPLEFFINNLRVYLNSIVGISNFYFLLEERNYFDTVFSDPFSHTWSLGVELQFYLVFPIFLFFLIKYINKFVSILTIFILIIIGIITTYSFEEDIKLIFYSPLFRFWEFLFGSLTFFLEKKIKFKNNQLSFLVFFILLLFIIIPIQISPTNTILISCILTSIFILFYKKKENKLTSSFIENKYLVFLGNISYSFYLWHLPIIYFYDLYYLNSFLRVPFLFITTLLLSSLSYRFIEKKFRYSKIKIQINFRNLSYILIIFSLIFSVKVLMYEDSYNNNLKYKIKNLVYNLNYLENKKNYTERIAYYKIKINENEVYRFCTEDSQNIQLNKDKLRVNCFKKGKNNNRIFFIEGNSYTAQFVPLFNQVKINDGIYFNHIGGPLANSSIDLMNSLLKKYKEVIYVTNISNDQYLDRLLEIKKKLNNDIKILILGSTPHVPSNIKPLSCFIKNIDCEYDIFYDLNKRNIKLLNSKIMKLVKDDNNINFFDPYESICPQKSCKVFDKQKNLITHRDASHLTIEGALLMVDDFMNFYKKNYSNYFN